MTYAVMILELPGRETAYISMHRVILGLKPDDKVVVRHTDVAANSVISGS
jgi:hypothetical protein